jgi:hypothetical protein
MITADKLKLLTNMPSAMLEQALPLKKRPKLQSARFLGITNGGEFCYSVVDTDGGEGKVFLKYDPTVDRVSATLG